MSEKAEEKVELTPEQQEALFSKVQKLNQAEEKAESTLQQIRTQRSEVLQQIREKMGSGPFDWNGQTLTISKKKDTYFFRSQSKKVVKIGK